MNSSGVMPAALYNAAAFGYLELIVSLTLPPVIIAEETDSSLPTSSMAALAAGSALTVSTNLLIFSIFSIVSGMIFTCACARGSGASTQRAQPRASMEARRGEREREGCMGGWCGRAILQETGNL